MAHTPPIMRKFNGLQPIQETLQKGVARKALLNSFQKLIVRVCKQSDFPKEKKSARTPSMDVSLCSRS